VNIASSGHKHTAFMPHENRQDSHSSLQGNPWAVPSDRVFVLRCEIMWGEKLNVSVVPV
jgi:hypothetical protein